jgi:hypothetical protein
VLASPQVDGMYIIQLHNDLMLSYTMIKEFIRDIKKLVQVVSELEYLVAGASA